MTINYGYGVGLSPDIPEKAREWRNLEEVYKWCRQVEPLTKSAHEDWLQRIKNDQSMKMYGIKKDYREVGVCGLTSINHINQTAEFNLYIAPEYQGKGYGTLALKTLLMHGFGALNLNVIWGEVFVGNKALDIDLKLGFQVEGTLRQRYFKDGRFIDTNIISILRSEWESQIASG